MYNSLLWEEDITRVYVLRPVGISSSEGVLFSSAEKGDIWCIVVWVCEYFVCACGLIEKKRTEGKPKTSMRGTVNVKHAALYLQAGKVQSSVCKYNQEYTCFSIIRCLYTDS